MTKEFYDNYTLTVDDRKDLKTTNVEKVENIVNQAKDKYQWILEEGRKLWHTKQINSEERQLYLDYLSK